MTDDELDPQEVEADVSEEQEAPERLEADRATEDEARKYGWRPKDEFKRDPQGWVDAKKFLDFPQTHNKKLRDELKAQQVDTDERIRRLEQGHAAGLRVQQERHRQQLADVRAAQERAVDIGDTDAYRKLRADEDALQKQSMPQRDPEKRTSANAFAANWIPSGPRTRGLTIR